jgi:glutamate 5-kinase
MALMDRPTSLLPAGVTSVAGEFESGAVVEISAGGTVFARGLVSMGSIELVGAAGLSGIGHVVHRDDLVIFE